MAAVRGLLRWMLPWYANGAEYMHPFDPDSIPPERFIDIPHLPNRVSVAQQPRIVYVPKTVNKLSTED